MDLEGEKFERVKYKLWPHGTEISFADYMEAVDEILREMMLPHILRYKHFHDLGVVKMIISKMTSHDHITNMIMQYVDWPSLPSLNARIFDSDVMQFSATGESFTNTWRRLVKEYPQVITPEVVKKVVDSIALIQNPDIANLGQVVYQYYQSRPDMSYDIYEYDRRYNVMFYGLLVGA